MWKFKLKGRSFSVDPPPASKSPSKGGRKRSISDMFETHRASSPSQERVRDVCYNYMGFATIEEPRSSKELQVAIRTVKETTLAQKPVKLVFQDGSLNVLEMNAERILACPLSYIVQCVHGSSDCFAVVFGGGHYGKQCHVFQANSSREAADIVQALQKAIRSAHKSLSKGRPVNDLNMAVSFTKPTVTGDSPKLGIHCMEDEGEILEVKRISQIARQESKRTIIRTSGETTSSANSLTGSTRISSSDSIPSLASWLGGAKTSVSSPKEKRRMRRGAGRGGEREFTRQDRVHQLRGAAERVVENNKVLRQACSKTYPASPFQDALNAMHSNSTQLLKSYLLSGGVSPDTYDSMGNSLLHYAVALGNVEVTRILCDQAQLDSSGWNDCRPLHRAAAEGNKNVLQILLLRGANVNSTDNMGRSPLHLVAGRLEYMECSIALLEYGAQIMTNDVLGLRPYDLCPELKETQNRLVTSTCEAFASSHLKNPTPLFSSQSTPMSTSPASTRPNSVMSGDHMGSCDLLTRPQRKEDILEEIRRAKALKAFSRRSRFKRWKVSRSISNLSELQEADEDEMYRRARLEKLKFPSEFDINSSYHKLEENAGTIVQLMNKMIRAGKRANTWSPDMTWNRSELSLSESNLNESDAEAGYRMVSPESRPLSSLSGEQYQHLVRSRKTRADSATSQSSAGTVVRGGSVDADSDIVSTVQRLSSAFEHLQEDLHRATLKHDELDTGEKAEDFVKLPKTMQNCLRHSVDLQPDTSPLVQKRSMAETNAIFNELIEQLQNASEELEPVKDGGGSCVDAAQLRNQSDAPPEGHMNGNLTSAPPEGQVTSDKNIAGAEISFPPRLQRRTSLDFNAHQQGPVKRKMSLPEVVIPSSIPSSLRGGSSNDLIAASTSSSAVSLEDSRYQRMNVVEGGKSGPVIGALKVMVSLSTNKECLPHLLSYVCLPKCVTRLTSLAQSACSSPDVLSNIAALMQNLFESGGAEGKKNAISSGILDLTIKLLHSRDPVPDTCLSLLNSLLVSEDDNDYLRTIIRIPPEPLLSYLEPYESDIDSGIENQHRDTSVSGTTRSSSDYQGQPTSNEGSRPNSDLGVAGMGGVGASVLGGKFRASSFNSETSESSSSRSIVRGHLVTLLEARRIVLKLLAVSSSHPKMQRELTSHFSISLVAECLRESSQENVTNAAITLANIAQNMDSHNLMMMVGMPNKLKSLLGSGPRPRYHAARALVYLGELDIGGTSLYAPTGYETDVLMMSDSDGHTYARGATIEKCVEFLTDNPSQLWGGFNLTLGQHSPPAGSMSPKATKEQIYSFFLTAYQSFTHPILLMRLLLHRLSSQEPGSPFNWSLPPNSSSIPPTPHSTVLPPTEINVLNLIGRWLEHFPDEFQEHPQLRQSVLDITQRLKLAKGPYTHYTHRLKSLLQDVGRPRNEVRVTPSSLKRTPHHENLYNLCKQMVTGGHLPVTLEQAIFMAGLQLHIEEIEDPTLLQTNGISQGKRRRNFTMRLRSSLPVSYTKAKQIGKRVRNQVLEFENVSERNSKHLYIERCRALPGYDCTFFSVRVPSAGRFRKGPAVKQLLGVSNRSVVFLDEKTKGLVTRYNLQDVQSISRETDPCSLLVSLRDGGSCRFQVETASLAWEITNVVEQCIEGEDWHVHGQSDLRWSDDSLPSFHTVSLGLCYAGSDESSTTSKENSPEREISGPVSTNRITASEKDPDALGVLNTSSSAHTANGHLSETPKMLSREDSIVTDISEKVLSEDKVLFCDCPPDPEIPPEINLKDLSIRDLLRCPLEVARQMTLIVHERFCLISSVELLQKISLVPKPSSLQHKPSTSTQNLPSSTLKHTETAIEKLAFRFNQVGNWVAHSILQNTELEDRVDALQQFITIAKHCMDFRNYSSVMAIVAGLGSSPIRRLRKTWEGISKQHMELYRNIDTIMDTRGSYKNYREKLVGMQTPAVPYVGVFLTDLTFICEGNPDFLHGGLINIHKRRQIYKTLEELRYFQQDHYNFHVVSELQEKLLSYEPAGEDELHSRSHQLEPRIHRSQSQPSGAGRGKSGAGVSTTQSFSLFRALSRSSSGSTSNLLKL